MKKNLNNLNNEVINKNLRLNDLKQVYDKVFIDKEIFKIKNLDEKIDYTSIQAEICTDKHKEYDVKSRSNSYYAFYKMVAAFISLILTLVVAKLFNSVYIANICAIVTVINISLSIIAKSLEIIYNNKSIYEKDKAIYYNIFFKSCSLEKELLLKNDEVKDKDYIEENIIDDDFDYDLVKDNLFIDNEKSFTRKRNKR